MVSANRKAKNRAFFERRHFLQNAQYAPQTRRELKKLAGLAAIEERCTLAHRQKIRFDTAQEAQLRADLRRRESPEVRLRTYLCSECLGWHLTSQRTGPNPGLSGTDAPLGHADAAPDLPASSGA